MSPAIALLAASVVLPAFTSPAAGPPAMPTSPADLFIIDSSTPVAPAVTSANIFGLNLYRKLCTDSPQKNLLIAPCAIAAALTMVAEGARGETQEQMARVLALPAEAEEGKRPIDAVHAAHAALAYRLQYAAHTAGSQSYLSIEEERAKLNALNQQMAELEREGKMDYHVLFAKAEETAMFINNSLAWSDRFELSVGNAVWVEKSAELNPTYVASIGRFYRGGWVIPVNFRRSAERERIGINSWVKNQTHGHIDALIAPGQVSSQTTLAVTSAAYFKGQWANPFLLPSTGDETFTLADGSTTKVTMMYGSWPDVPYAAFTSAGEYFNTPTQVPADPADLNRPKTYPGTDGFQLIELPYKGGELAMTLIAPMRAAGMPALEKRLTTANLDIWQSSLRKRTVDTTLPRFKLQSQHNLSGPLQAMGMQRAFVSPTLANGADFSGLSTATKPKDKPFIGLACHKVCVEVDEKGPELAAAFTVRRPPGSGIARAGYMVPFTPHFYADHPFIFIVRDTKSGVILFMGRMMNPAE